MISNLYKKTLDKIAKVRYNTYMDREVDLDTFIADYVEPYSSWKELSVTTIEQITSLGDKIEDKWSKHFPTNPLPCIAGGSVRDAVFGLSYKDIDVFFNMKGIGEGWKESTGFEDGPEMVVELFMEDIGLSRINKLGENYLNLPVSKLVLDSTLEIVGGEGGDQVQFVGCQDIDKSTDCINSFDYDLCKIAYNIEDKKFIVSKEFQEGLEKIHSLKRSNDIRQESREQRFLCKVNSIYFNIKANSSITRYKEPAKKLQIVIEPIKEK